MNAPEQMKDKNETEIRQKLIDFLRQQARLKYITIYQNDWEFADKILEEINKR